MRTESLVKADSAEDAAETLTTIGHSPRQFDRAFLFGTDRMMGVHRCDIDGVLVPDEAPIEQAPATLRPLSEEAKASGKFTAQRALHAADELTDTLASDVSAAVEFEFGQFHDRYVLLSAKITNALDIVAQGDGDGRGAPEPTGGNAEDDDSEASAEELTIEKVEGLGVDDVRKQLPHGVVMADSTLAETVTALRAGKHLIFSGPPGTGKSTLATAVCQAVGAGYRTATATADWSTVDTIGAYLRTRRVGGR